MYTQEQTQALTEYKQTLKEYNAGNITYEEYIEKTLPLWNELNFLFTDSKK